MARRSKYRPTPPADAEGVYTAHFSNHAYKVHWRLDGDTLTIHNSFEHHGGTRDPALMIEDQVHQLVVELRDRTIARQRGE